MSVVCVVKKYAHFCTENALSHLQPRRALSIIYGILGTSGASKVRRGGNIIAAPWMDMDTNCIAAIITILRFHSPELHTHAPAPQRNAKEERNGQLDDWEERVEFDIGPQAIIFK